MRRRRILAAASLQVLLVAGCATAPDPSAAPPAPPAASSTLTPTPTPTPTPQNSATPAASSTPGPTASPTPAPAAVPATGPAGRPTRIAVRALGIDLPVVPPPTRSTWPLCDVAEYFKPPTFQHPGAGGVTYIYAHAQAGMFLPILEASRVDRGQALIGRTVQVWTARNHLYTYRITRVRRHQKTLAWAFDLPPNFLILQTSEDQYRTGTKVMVQAKQVGAPVLATPAEARPRAEAAHLRPLTGDRGTRLARARARRLARWPRPSSPPRVLRSRNHDQHRRFAELSLHVRVRDRGSPRQDVRPDLGRHPRRHHLARTPTRASHARRRRPPDSSPSSVRSRRRRTSTSRRSSARPSERSATRRPTTGSTTRRVAPW